MPFRPCVPESGSKLQKGAPSFVTFWRELFTAEVPNELTRDVIFSGSAPCLEQPAGLKIACWPGCDKKKLPVALQTSEEQRRNLKGEKRGAPTSAN